MERIAYTVTATLPDEPTARRYIAWLEDGHVDAVIAGGAHSAMIVRLLDEPAPGPIRVETRYIFATRELFDRYLAEHAPALRQEGLALFGPGSGVSFSRTVGRVV